jgi:mono/diheme cytochrome c family protein
MIRLSTLAGVVALGALLAVSSVWAQGKWECPKDVSTKKSPAPYSPQSVAAGKQVAEAKACSACHGASGKGDGPGAAALNPKPADWTSATTQGDSDGCLFWKITEGRGAMPKWGPLTTDKERWDLVNYVRSFGKK